MGTDLLDSTNATTTAVSTAATTLEQSRSFLDNAQRQLSEIGKQVFGQNRSFGNKSNQVTTTPLTACSGVSENHNIENLSEQHAAAAVSCIPIEVKKEIKENISPEHTINEETLVSLQKMFVGGGAAASNLSEEPAESEKEETITAVDAETSTTTT